MGVRYKGYEKWGARCASRVMTLGSIRGVSEGAELAGTV